MLEQALQNVHVLLQGERMLLGGRIAKPLNPLFFYIYPANVHESRVYPLILEIPRRKLIRFGDAIVIDKGFYAYRNPVRIRYGIVPLIIPKKNFRLERLEG